ncbi:MAG TPA: hypothetical protein VF278_03635 [Pirellulales bacterium]
MLEESDTYLMILEQGEERATRRDILLVGEARLGAADEAIKNRLANIKDSERLARMVQKAATALTWEEILEAH